MKKLLLPFVFILTASAVFAQMPVKFMASEDISYDDNIYLTENNTRDSFISTTRVGAAYETQIPDSSLLLNANATVGYNAYTRDSSANNSWDALADIGLKNEFFSLGNTFLYTSDPANNSLTERAKRITNRTYFDAISSTEKMFGAGLTLANTYNRYMKDIWEDLNRNRIDAGVQLYYNISPMTNFYAEYVYTDINYNTNKVNNSQGGAIGLGVKTDFTAKLTGNAKVTYDYRNYANDLAGADNFNSLIGYFLALKWTPNTLSEVSISGSRTMEETVFINDRYFEDTNITVAGSYKFQDRFTGSLALSYDNMNYRKTDRTYDLYTIRPSVDYQFMDWLSAGVWYQYRARASNGPFEYDNNKVGVFVKGTF